MLILVGLVLPDCLVSYVLRFAYCVLGFSILGSYFVYYYYLVCENG